MLHLAKLGVAVASAVATWMLQAGWDESVLIMVEVGAHTFAVKLKRYE